MSLLMDTYNYWTKTPNVIANAFDSVGFAVSKTTFGATTPMLASFARSAVNPSLPALTATHSPTDSGITKLKKAGAVVGGGLGKVTGKSAVIASNIGEGVLDTVSAVADPNQSVFGSTALKYALIAGGAFALYKFGGEFVAGKGAQFARKYR